jgi:hypothetical protein
MNHQEEQSFEAELARLKPSSPPEPFLARLSARCPPANPEPGTFRLFPQLAGGWWRWARWLAPATAAALLLVLLVFTRPAPSPPQLSARPQQALRPALKADDVEIDRRLVGVFDAVATWPDGEPVRFRCRQWIDDVVVRDSERGVLIHQRTPRLEVVPVRFETD